MNRKERIYKLLINKFKEFSIVIEDNSHLHIGHNNFNGKNETHIQVLLRNKSSKKFDRLSIHRTINNLLKNEFKEGLHSLEIKIS